MFLNVLSLDSHLFFYEKWNNWATQMFKIKDVIFPRLFEFSGIGKSREIVTISREFSGTGFMHNNPKYQPKFNIIKIILSTFNVMDIID